jgi:hypothetical protein
LATFEASVLRRDEREREPHASALRLTRALLTLRRREPLVRLPDWAGFDARAIDADSLAFWRTQPGLGVLVVVVRLRGSGASPLPARVPRAAFSVVLTTEDEGFAPDPCPIRFAPGPEPGAEFVRPGALVLRG